MVNIADLTPAGANIASSLITGRKDPQLNYMWEVGVIGGPRSIIGAPTTKMYAQTCVLPQRTVEIISRRYMGEEVNHTGHKTSPNTVRMNMWDDRSLAITRYFHEWFNTLSDPSEGKGVNIQTAKRDMFLMLKDRSDFFIGALIEFKGAYIHEIGAASLSYLESAPMTFDLTFRFDKMIINGQEYKLTEQGGGTIQTIQQIVSSLR